MLRSNNGKEDQCRYHKTSKLDCIFLEHHSCSQPDSANMAVLLREAKMYLSKDHKRQATIKYGGKL